VIDEEGDVVAARAQRRGRDGDHVEAVKEVFSEAARGDLGAKILVRGGDDADVGADRVAADGLVLALLQHAEELHLHAGASSPISSRKSVPPGGLREAAFSAGEGSRERAALVAEQLRLEDALGDRGAVDGDEGALAARGAARGCSAREAPFRCRSRRG
jgi:hypothetical protein